MALAGDVTDWGLASGLGGWQQRRLPGITRNGPAYLAGALAFAEHWMTTEPPANDGAHDPDDKITDDAENRYLARFGRATIRQQRRPRV